MNKKNKRSNRHIYPKQRLLSIAIHEAGHAAAHLWYQHDFDKKSIVPKGKALGYVEYTRPQRLLEILNYDDQLSAEDERYFKHESIILMAGGAAQIKFEKKRKYGSGCRGDFAELQKNCSSINIDGQLLKAYTDYIIEEAKQLFRRQEIWECTVALANLLLEKRELDFATCKAQYDQIVGEYSSETTEMFSREEIEREIQSRDKNIVELQRRTKELENQLTTIMQQANF